MNIGAISLAPAVSQAKARSEVGVRMLAKAMDTNEQAGAGVIKMIDAAAMERSVNPSVGANFDASV